MYLTLLSDIVIFLPDQLFPGAVNAVVGDAEVIAVARIRALDHIVAQAFTLPFALNQAVWTFPTDLSLRDVGGELGEAGDGVVPQAAR